MADSNTSEHETGSSSTSEPWNFDSDADEELSEDGTADEEVDEEYSTVAPLTNIFQRWQVPKFQPPPLSNLAQHAYVSRFGYQPDLHATDSPPQQNSANVESDQDPSPSTSGTPFSTTSLESTLSDFELATTERSVRCGVYGRTQEQIDEDIRMDLMVMKQTKKNYPKSLLEMPMPILSDEEKQFPPSRLDLRIAIKKCESAGTYGFLKLYDVLALLIPAARVPPVNQDGTIEAPAICTLSTPDFDVDPNIKPYPFEPFSFTWVQNIDKVVFLNQWLSSRARRSSFTEVEPAMLRRVMRHSHQVCILAISPIDGLYGRAVVQHAVYNNRARVLLIDSGHSVIVSVKTLKMMKSKLFDLEPLSSFCILADVTDHGMSNPYKTAIDNDFKKILSAFSTKLILKLKIPRFEDEFKEVYLYTIHKDKKICLNDILQEQYTNLNNKLTNLEPPLPIDLPTAAELAKQMHSDVETHISKPPDNIGKGVLIYQMTQVTSPTQFYMVKISQDANQMRITPEWYNYMQTFYDDAEYSQEYNKFTARAFTNRCYMWKYPENGRWERVRLSEVDYATMTCRVFLVDIGIFVEALQSQLCEIDPKFVSQPGLALKGKLQHIQPFGFNDWKEGFNADIEEDEEGISKIWSAEAVRAMRSLAEGRYFYGTSIPDSGYFPNTQLDKSKMIKMLKKRKEANVIKKFGMVFVELTQKSDMTLNGELCFKLKAQAFGLGGGNLPLLSVDGTGSPAFDYPGMRRVSMQTERELFVDPGEDPVIEHLQRLKKEAKLKAEPDVLDLNDYFRWLNSQIKSIEPEKRLPMIVRTKIGMCIIKNVFSPSCFYVQLESKIDELRIVMKSLGVQMGKRCPLQDADVVVGLPVALLLTNHDEYFKAPTWYRGVVKQAMPGLGMCKVVLTDYGTEVNIDNERLYPLPKYFQNLPGYCIRVHLDVADMGPGNNEEVWSGSTIELFKRYITTWAGEDPVYYVWRTKSTGNVKLDIYNQELYFDCNTLKWDKVPFDEAKNYTYTASEASHSDIKNEKKEGKKRTTTSAKVEIQTDSPTVNGNPATGPVLPSLTRMDFATMPIIAGGPLVVKDVPFKRSSCSAEHMKGLENLFTSIGVDLSYEIFTAPDRDYTFDPGWDLLADNELAARYT